MQTETLLEALCPNCFTAGAFKTRAFVNLPKLISQQPEASSAPLPAHSEASSSGWIVRVLGLLQHCYQWRCSNPGASRRVSHLLELSCSGAAAAVVIISLPLNSCVKKPTQAVCSLCVCVSAQWIRTVASSDSSRVVNSK